MYIELYKHIAYQEKFTEMIMFVDKNLHLEHTSSIR